MKTKLMALEALKNSRKELHACQAVIHLAGGFDPEYVRGAQAAMQRMDEVIAALEADIAEPVESVEFGTGSVGVHAGRLNDRPTLWISTKGAGVIGVPTTHEDGAVLATSDTRCVLRFGNDASLRVVIDELTKLYTTPQEPAATGGTA